jgi:tetratricopeptide (TPR) repeat protein
MLTVLADLDGFLEVDSDLFKLMLDAEEASVMRRYLQRLGRESVERLSRKYAFEVKKPILMEMFPNHQDFAVRTVGFTGLGALGACFGEVVTLLSPRAAPFRAQFSWSSTLHHELCHAFTLQMSKYRIPRWLTEGISVFEESELNPYWRRNMDMELFNAYHNGRLFTLENFDGGFMSARVLFAYYQAGLTVTFIVERFGIEGLREMIRAYGDDLGTARIVKKVSGMEAELFEKAFQEWLWKSLLSEVKCQPFYDADKKRELMAEANRNPDDLGALLKAAWACLRNGKTVDALYFLNKVKRIQSDHGLGALLRGEIAFQKDDVERSEKYYLQAIEAGVEDLFAYRNLGMMARGKGEVEKAIEYLEKAKACFPSYIGPASPRMALLEIFSKEKREDEAVREMEGLLSQGLQDINLFIKVGRHYVDKNMPDKAAPIIEAAIHMDPFRRDVHVFFARELRKLSRHGKALEELDMALGLETGPEGHFTPEDPEFMTGITAADIHAEKGANLLALGDRDAALKEVEKALAFDANHALALELKKKLETQIPDSP